MRATIDFESRSARSLKKSGAWRYACDPTTEILCLAFRLPTWEAARTSLWVPAFPHIGVPESDNWSDVVELVEWIQDGGLVEAHNVWFEYCIWNNILIPQHGFPEIKHDKWRCSAAKASACALPRGLDDVATALKLPLHKDMEGHKLMMKLSKPRKSRKKERETWEKTGEIPPALLWHESVELFARLGRYCRQDVLVEEAVSHALPDLSPHETEMFLMDLAVNRRGFQIDSTAVTTALTLISSESTRLNHELRKVTKGVVKKATQRAQMIEWFGKHGLELLDTQKDTIDGCLESTTEYEPRVRRALEIVRTLGRSSTAKYQAMQNWMDEHDGRVRGGMLYHGATTGRWSGAGVQPHNFPKGTIRDQSRLWADLHATRSVVGGDGERLDPLDALSQGLRGAIVAPLGRQLFVADYAAIEARVVLWLADDQKALDIFRRHEDIYLEMASAIYHRPCTKADKEERALGKIAVLGLGFQMGASKFVATCAKFGITIDEDFAKTVVDAYRNRFYRVKQMWWEMEDTAILAVKSPGKPVPCGRIEWIKDGIFLYCVLPSGRRLSYPYPLVKQKETPWSEMKPSLTFMGVNPYNHQWQRQTTYGGCLVENATQAVARDLMAEGMLRCQESGIYDLVLSVHDELVAEADEGTGSVKDFETLMAMCPDWAKGCPIEAEGWSGTRYRK